MNKAAERGSADALGYIGDNYYFGEEGYRKNPARAFEYYAKAAQKGDALSEFNLAAMYLSGGGTMKDVGAARAWFEKAAMQHDYDAQYWLGQVYASGWGENAPDPVLATGWYALADYKGRVGAAGALGELLLSGKEGNKDPRLAAIWLREDARLAFEGSVDFGSDSGSKDVVDARVSANLTLASLYLSGKGVKKDPYLAFSYYQWAAERNNDEAELMLGRLYGAGTGCVADRDKAIAWYKKAAAQGNGDAKKALDALTR